jgi:hypothetical protein
MKTIIEFSEQESRRRTMELYQRNELMLKMKATAPTEPVPDPAADRQRRQALSARTSPSGRH